MSGIYPPWGMPNLMRASDISQEENAARRESSERAADIARETIGKWRTVVSDELRSYLICSMKVHLSHAFEH